MLAWLTFLNIIYYRKLRVLPQDILNCTQIIEQYSDVVCLNRASETWRDAYDKQKNAYGIWVKHGFM